MTNKIRLYWPLINSLQTGLLLSTGIAGYLSSGQPFSISLLLGLSLLFWIPTYTLTYSMKFRNDHKNAGVPTFPETYGEPIMRLTAVIMPLLAFATVRVHSDKMNSCCSVMHRCIC